MLKSERIGYGYERGDKAFRGHNCDLVVIDTKQTKREGRGDVMRRLTSRDTLVIFSWKELAPGALKATMKADLERMGVTVEVIEPPVKPSVKPSQRGMSDEAKAFALEMWRKPTEYSFEYIQAELERKGFGTYTRNQLNHALKRRTPPADAPVEVGE